MTKWLKLYAGHPRIRLTASDSKPWARGYAIDWRLSQVICAGF
jgi:hypothetical protein